MSVILAFVIGLVVVDVLGVLAFYRYIEGATPRKDNGPFDAGVVFFADERSIGAMTVRNLNIALDLYRQQAFPVIVAIGGSRPAIGFFGSEGMRDWLGERGVPPEAVRTERASFDADSGWAAMLAQLRQLDARRVTLVTDPMHQLRLRQRFNQAPDIEFIVNTYRYDATTPPFSLIEKWYRAHYELTAVVAERLIPQSLYVLLLRLVRA